MIVQVEELCFDTDTQLFFCPDHPEHPLQPIRWAGVGYVCEVPIATVSKIEPSQCLKFAQWSNVEVRDEDVSRILRVARNGLQIEPLNHGNGVRLPELFRKVRTLFR